LITGQNDDSWPRASKITVANQLALNIADHLDAAS
jgi:hypothetical protein